MEQLIQNIYKTSADSESFDANRDRYKKIRTHHAGPPESPQAADREKDNDNLQACLLDS